MVSIFDFKMPVNSLVIWARADMAFHTFYLTRILLAVRGFYAWLSHIHVSVKQYTLISWMKYIQEYSI